MNGKIFGVTFGTILLVAVVAVAVRLYGSKIPGLNSLGA